VVGSKSIKSTVQKDVQTASIGLLADNAEELGKLVAMLRGGAYQVECAIVMSRDCLPLRDDIDVWLIRVGQDADDSEEVSLVLDWLQEQDRTFVLQDVNQTASMEPATQTSTGALPGILTETLLETTSGASREAMQRTLLQKLDETFASLRRDEKNTKKPEPIKVWVLAASTGGPEAVSEFLQSLGACSEQAAAQCAFIYVQHIEAYAFASLVSKVNAHSELEVQECIAGERIQAGRIYVAHPEQAFGISESRRFVATTEPWKGDYQPSVNQVIAKVARIYRQQSGAIVFTGMGDDGADSARLMSAMGGEVMVQSFDSCTVDSMPKCASEATNISLCASIADLAAAVVSDAQNSALRADKV